MISPAGLIKRWTIYVCESCGKPEQDNGDMCVCESPRLLRPVEVEPTANSRGAVDLLCAIREPIEDTYQDSSNWKDLRHVLKQIDAYLSAAGGRYDGAATREERR